MSETIWLNPQLIGDKTIFVQIKNTSTSNIDLENHIKNILTEKGYKIGNYLKEMLTIDLSKCIKCWKMDLKDSELLYNWTYRAGIWNYIRNL